MIILVDIGGGGSDWIQVNAEDLAQEVIEDWHQLKTDAQNQHKKTLTEYLAQQPYGTIFNAHGCDCVKVINNE